MFKTRLLSGILLVLIALITIISGGDVLFVTVLLISLIGMSELYKVLKVHNKLLGIVGYVACIAYYGLIRFGKSDMVDVYKRQLLNAATAYRAAGLCEQAILMYQDAERIFLELGVQDDRLAGLYNNMSMAFQQEKDYEEAMQCLLQALEIIKLLPERKAEEATTYANLASVCYENKQFEEGIRYVELAVERFQECEEKDAHYCGALALLAQGYYLQGELEKAITSYTEALREILSCFGKNESYAMTCENCAVVLKEAGFAKEAAYLEKEAQETYEKIRKPEKELSGLELARCYYETYGRPMLETQFPDYADRVAAGLVGHGSRCV